MTRRSHRWLLAARIAASVGALVMIVWRVDVGATWDAIAGAQIVWIAAAFALNLVAVMLSTALWRAMTPAGGVSFVPATGMYLAGIFHNNLGLGTTVGDAMRVAAMRDAGGRTGDAAASVLGERALSFGALVVMASVGAIFVAGENAALAVTIWAAAILAIVTGGSVVLLAPRAASSPRVPLRVAALASDVHEALTSLLRQPRRLVAGAMLAVAVQACTVAATLALLRAVDADGSMLLAAALVPPIALCVLLPISIQGIGVRETTYVALLGIAGVAPEQALAAAVLSYATTLAISALGAGVILREAISATRRRSVAQGVVAEEERLRLVA